MGPALRSIFRWLAVGTIGVAGVGVRAALGGYGNAGSDWVGQADLDFREAQYGVDQARWGFEDADRRAADLSAQLNHARDEVNALQRRVDDEAAALSRAPVEQAPAKESAEVAGRRREMQDVSRRYEAAKAKLDEAVGAEVRDFEQTASFHAAKDGLNQAQDELGDATIRALSMLSGGTAYQAAEARSKAAADRMAATPSGSPEQADAQREWDAARDALQSMRSEALGQDPGVRVAQSKLSGARGALTALRADFDKTLAYKPAVVDAQAALDAEQPVYDAAADALDAALAKDGGTDRGDAEASLAGDREVLRVARGDLADLEREVARAREDAADARARLNEALAARSDAARARDEALYAAQWEREGPAPLCLAPAPVFIGVVPVCRPCGWGRPVYGFGPVAPLWSVGPVVTGPAVVPVFGDDCVTDDGFLFAGGSSFVGAGRRNGLRPRGWERSDWQPGWGRRWHGGRLVSVEEARAQLAAAEARDRAAAQARAQHDQRQRELDARDRATREAKAREAAQQRIARAAQHDSTIAGRRQRQAAQDERDRAAALGHREREAAQNTRDRVAREAKATLAAEPQTGKRDNAPDHAAAVAAGEQRPSAQDARDARAADAEAAHRQRQAEQDARDQAARRAVREGPQVIEVDKNGNSREVDPSAQQAGDGQAAAREGKAAAGTAQRERRESTDARRGSSDDADSARQGASRARAADEDGARRAAEAARSRDAASASRERAAAARDRDTSQREAAQRQATAERRQDESDRRAQGGSGASAAQRPQPAAPDRSAQQQGQQQDSPQPDAPATGTPGGRAGPVRR